MAEQAISISRINEQLAQKEKLLHTINIVATTLLSVHDEDTFESAITKSMEILGSCVGVERAHIWRSGQENDRQVIYHIYEWDRFAEVKKPGIPLNGWMPLDTFPRWENIVKNGEIIHGTLSTLPPDIQDFFATYKLKSVAFIPLFLHDKFWGVFALDSVINERDFMEEEINILQSAGLMMINAILRDESLREINEEHGKTERLAHWYHSILDAIPLPISVTDDGMMWTYINSAAENFLGIKRKDMLGKHCSNWKADICKSENCGVVCIKHGIKQTYFKQNNLSFKVDVEVLKDLENKTIGYIEIVQNITEIEAMSKKQAEAEAASRAKSAFLANMSHEMRTPMNALLGIAEIHLNNKNIPEDIKKALGQIYESGDLLLNIINDILDLSRIEAGKMELIPVNYDIPSLINDTAQLNRLLYENSGIKFIIHVDENTPNNLLGDALRIKQVLNNLLSNAFKYTEKGIIEFLVYCEREDSGDMTSDISGSSNIKNKNVTLVFRLSDSGYGMTEEQIAKLFDEYTRFNEKANRETTGTGLGMSITKRLIDLMGGTITVESELGKGSVFTVRLPQKQTGTEVCGSELTNTLKNFSFQSLNLKKKAQFLREYMPYGSVLIVDDVESNIYVARGMLLLYGLKIETVTSGFEAIEKIKKGCVYDIIFMDHMMPKMDGIETTKILRGLGYKHTIIALTANALLGQEKMFLENGFDGFISKPIDSRELNHILNDFIRNRKPPELVEAARMKQQERESRYAADDSRQYYLFESNQKAFFAKDAVNALNILEKLYEKINNLNDNELKLFIVTIHGIKSALANIGEKQLSACALLLEQAASEKNLEVMLNETKKFINELKTLLLKYKPAKELNAETRKDAELSEGDVLFLRGKLQIIKKACGEFNKNAAKAALDEIKHRQWPEKINAVLEDITLHLLHSAFKKASAAAEELIKI